MSRKRRTKRKISTIGNKFKRSLNIDWFKNYKGKQECLACGEGDPSCIEFHHVNPKEKRRSISGLVRSGASFEILLEELKKCAPLCSNCHKKHHSGSAVLIFKFCEKEEKYKLLPSFNNWGECSG